jgi:hypothetical protein
MYKGHRPQPVHISTLFPRARVRTLRVYSPWAECKTTELSTLVAGVMGKTVGVAHPIFKRRQKATEIYRGSQNRLSWKCEKLNFSLLTLHMLHNRNGPVLYSCLCTRSLLSSTVYVHVYKQGRLALNAWIKRSGHLWNSQLGVTLIQGRILNRI